MADIHSIVTFAFTSKSEDSGTDGDLYLGICGREFYLDTSEDNYETGLADGPIVGVDSNVTSPAMNDPRTPYRLTREDLDRFPVYIRLDGTDHWKTRGVMVWVYSGDPADLRINDTFATPVFTGDSGLYNGMWLGPSAGKWLHLRRTSRDLQTRLLKAMGVFDEVMKRLPPTGTTRRPASRPKKRPASAPKRKPATRAKARRK